MANPQSHPELHRRAFVLGLVAFGAAGTLASAAGGAAAAPALPMSPDLPEAPPLAADALFRSGEDETSVESVQWGRRCWYDRWGRRVCRGYPPPWRPRPRRVCWWRNGRRFCTWR
jgi:hypothetical protein